MADDVIRIRYGISVNYIAGSASEDVEEIDREEWEAMSPAEQEEYLEGICQTEIANQVDAWAYVEEE